MALVVDQPASGARLLLHIAREARVPVAYVPGCSCAGAADLYAAAAAKTDPKGRLGGWPTTPAATLTASPGSRSQTICSQDCESSTVVTWTWRLTPAVPPTGSATGWWQSPRLSSGPWAGSSTSPVSRTCSSATQHPPCCTRPAKATLVAAWRSGRPDGQQDHRTCARRPRRPDPHPVGRTHPGARSSANWPGTWNGTLRSAPSWRSRSRRSSSRTLSARS